MTMQPRPYQTSMAHLAKRQNIIVHQRTGTGKTFTAVLVLDHFLTEQPDKKVMFVVPTRPLVQQQAQYIRHHSRHRHLRVEELCGDSTDNWRAAQWQQTGPVLVGTAELFRRALAQAFITPAHFSLWVLDECHNAVGNSPFSNIMRLLHDHQPREEWPRILGLTASFVNGTLRSIEEKRLKLEKLLQATMHCPDTSAVAQEQEYTTVTFEKSTMYEQTDWIENMMEGAFALFSPEHQVLLKDKKKLVSCGKSVFQNLGTSAFIYFLKHCLIVQLQQCAEDLLRYAPLGKESTIRMALENLPLVEEKLSLMVDDMGMSGPDTKTPKFCRLVELLQKLEGAGEDGLALGIIFVEQIMASYCLSELLNESFGRRVSLPINGPMPTDEQSSNLEAFRKRDVRILVATGALEEGLNVPECSWVIRFDRLYTTKQHIQGSGRARNSSAHIYLFENDVAVEEENRQQLENVAMDLRLMASEEQLEEGRQPLNFVPGQHPFIHESTGARFDVNTCLPILYEYCQTTLRQALQPDRTLYVYDEMVATVMPFQVIKKVVLMQYPSPDGVWDVTEQQVRDYWGETEMWQVFPSETCSKMSQADKQKRWFAFVTLVDLVRRRYLTEENRASPRALLLTREACPDFSTVTPGFRLHRRIQLDTPVQEPPSVGASSVGPTVNWKGLLQEWVQQLLPHDPIEELLVYSTQELSLQVFQSSVQVTTPQGTQVYGGGAQTSKKRAEQDAAQKACIFLKQRL